MGVESYLVNKKTQRLFELGKGMWFELQKWNATVARNEPTAALWDEAALRSALIEITRFWEWPDGGADRELYAAELAKRLRAFVGYAAVSDIDIELDSGDRVDLYESKGWPIVDTRYSDHWSREPTPCCHSIARDDGQQEHTYTCSIAKANSLPRRCSYMDDER